MSRESELVKVVRAYVVSGDLHHLNPLRIALEVYDASAPATGETVRLALFRNKSGSYWARDSDPHETSLDCIAWVTFRLPKPAPPVEVEGSVEP